ncbi:MAG: hypothetical protein ACKVK3_17025, partial [Acidimicrobiales bacterium]
KRHNHTNQPQKPPTKAAPKMSYNPTPQPVNVDTNQVHTLTVDLTLGQMARLYANLEAYALNGCRGEACEIRCRAEADQLWSTIDHAITAATGMMVRAPS